MTKKEYFKGWYFKCAGDNRTVAFIPSFHCSNSSAYLQIITDDNAFCLPFPQLKYREDPLLVKIGNNVFSEKGIKLNIKTNDLTAQGALRFGELSPIRYDIMGPFKFVPFMQCRHSVYSMSHSSLMLSAADIPMLGFSFTGIIGIVMLNGKEYRIATYLGAIIKHIGNNTITVSQGDYELTAKLIKKNAYPLSAPVNGEMRRTIHESASCKTYYRFSYKGAILCEFKSDRASFEFEYL